MRVIDKIQLGIVLAIIAVLGFAAIDYSTLRKRNAEQSEKIDKLSEDLESERTSRERMAEEFVRRAEFDAEVRKRRAASQSRINEVSHEDSPAGDYLRTRIPDGVRDAHFGR